MADYYNMHYKLTSDAKLLGKSKLEPGMIARLKYKNSDGKLVRYVVFVLNPKWPRTGNSKLHCISLSEIGVDKFGMLAKTYPEILSENKLNTRLQIPILDIGDEHKKFYLKEVKNNIKLDLFNGYRTFNLKQIVTVYVVNYDWGKFDRIPSKEKTNREERKKIIENENKLRNTDSQ